MPSHEAMRRFGDDERRELPFVGVRALRQIAMPRRCGARGALSRASGSGGGRMSGACGSEPFASRLDEALRLLSAVRSGAQCVLLGCWRRKPLRGEVAFRGFAEGRGA
jgi:hypothetical protein